MMMPTIASARMPNGTGTPPPRASSPVNNPIPATKAVVILSLWSSYVSFSARSARMRA